VTIDAEQSCPEEHPETFLHETWKGTFAVSLCYDRAGEATIDMNLMYLEDDEHCERHNGLAPVVMNNINGVKYCGKLGGQKYRLAVKPVETVNDDGSKSYSCPGNYESCNPDAMKSDPSKVTCYDPS